MQKAVDFEKASDWGEIIKTFPFLIIPMSLLGIVTGMLICL